MVKALGMMIAAEAATERRVAFDHRSAREFAAPNDERFIQQAALFECL